MTQNADEPSSSFLYKIIFCQEAGSSNLLRQKPDCCAADKYAVSTFVFDAVGYKEAESFLADNIFNILYKGNSGGEAFTHMLDVIESFFHFAIRKAY